MPLFGYGAPRPQFGAGFDPRQHIPMPGPISGYGGGTFNMDGTPATPNQRMMDPGQPLSAPLPAPVQAPQKPVGFWQGGDKFRTRDGLAAALAVIGDVAAQQSGGQAGAVASMTGNRLSAIDMARKQQEDAIRRQQERQEGLQDYTAKREIDQRYETPASNIEIREDNAGNVWHFDKRTGMPLGEAPAWIDRAPKQYMQDGMLINVPNPFLQGKPQQRRLGPVVDQIPGGPTPPASGTFRPPWAGR